MKCLLSCVPVRLCTSSSLNSCGWSAATSTLSLLICPCPSEKAEFKGSKVNHTLNVAFHVSEAQFTFSLSAASNFLFFFCRMLPATDLQLDYSLTDDFCRNHFLVGLLMREVGGALQEFREIRQIAIQVLKGLMIKHTFDDRYAAKVSSTTPLLCFKHTIKGSIK